ncbi:MFS transporter [Cypionkella psychrotolerans]|uniref:MFS transporter n=1 Tax=Cypionkella psychrotolerans TaxID=1678131 RepID=UPI0006B4E6ED|nr:MFS transporter [Cypionkella psychrotolerans]
MTALNTLRVARPAVAAFAAMGVLWGSFAADLPDIKTMLDIDESRLGALMFMTPIAAVCAMLVAPRLGVAFGRRAMLISCLLMCVAFTLPGQFSHLLLFPLAMMACGAGTGLTDVLMNARVATIETQSGRPLMNLCHAAYSFGYAGGAIATGALRSAGWSPAWVLCSMALLAGVIALASYEEDGRILGLARPKGKGAAHLGWVPVIGGAMVLIAFLTENAAENWSALHIEKNLGGSPSDGAMGPAVMAITMGVARLFGQGLASRVPAVWLLTGGAVISAVGALGAALAITPAMAYAGFIVMGIGSSVIAPTVFSLVGQLSDPAARARAVARATLIGYFGYFFGPPAIGFVAGQFGLRFAFVCAAVMLAGIPVLARVLLRR